MLTFNLSQYAVIILRGRKGMDMANRSKKEDFARVRASLQRELKKGTTIDEAVEKAALEEPDAFKRVIEKK